jgi:hypothetical protein
MPFLDLAEFKKFIKELLWLIIKNGDTQAVKDQEKITFLSTELTKANVLNVELRAALDSADQVKAKALADQLGDQLSDLDKFSTELETEFNPSKTADLVTEAVKDLPQVDAPVVVTEAVESGETQSGEPTDPAVVEAAVEAIVQA